MHVIDTIITKCRQCCICGILLCFGTILTSCKSKPTESTEVVEASQTTTDGTNNLPMVGLPFDFDEASEIIVLDESLVEISGIAYEPEKNRLLAINDEEGAVYIVDRKSGAAIKWLIFGKNRDYEGLVCTPKTIYALESDGDIYRIDIASASADIEKTPLTSKSDAEGLTLLPDGRLLIACKGYPRGEATTARKVIYSYSSRSKVLAEYISITDDDLESMAKKKFGGDSKSKVRKNIKRATDFAPSGVAYDERTGHTYIISARGSTLVVVDEKGVLADLILLPKNTMPQPEAICFDSDGNLYIATEGQGLTAKIFVYNRK